jgi:hypothetical protein
MASGKKISILSIKLINNIIVFKHVKYQQKFKEKPEKFRGQKLSGKSVKSYPFLSN